MTYLFILAFCAVFPIAARVVVYPHQAENPICRATERPASLPFISGDTFRSIADVVLDERKIPFRIESLRDGDIIFLNADGLSFFFRQVHPHITKRYILITHNSDKSAPGTCAPFLDDPHLIAWFGQNNDLQYPHPKFFPIPIGLPNAAWAKRYGDPKTVEKVRSMKMISPRQYFAYLNVKERTHSDRSELSVLLSDKEWCVISERKSYKDYLIDLANAQFVFSPQGYGLDCYRTWEALVMGAIPVVKRSTIDCLYEGLPVIIIDDWSRVTPELLLRKKEELEQTQLYPERMFAHYWLDIILAVQKRVRDGI